MQEALAVRLWIYAQGLRERAEWGGEGGMAPWLRDEEAVCVTDATFRSFSDTRAPQGLLCVFQAPRWQADRLLAADGPILALDGVQDPGNLGTMARSAEAAGAGGLLLGRATVDPGNPKALRASAGSLLRLPSTAVGDLGAAIKDTGRAVVAAAGRDGIPYDEADLTGPFLLLIGQEGRGLSPDLLRCSDLRVSVPMAGRAESLNAATAAAVILFEAARQRRARQAAGRQDKGERGTRWAAT